MAQDDARKAEARKRARADLAQAMAELRARIDPDLLQAVRAAAMESGAAQQALGTGQGRTVPYDRDAAEQAVKLFLAQKEKRDGGKYKARLKELLLAEALAARQPSSGRLN